MKDLLPIGSVVLLKDATKKLVIIGELQVNAEQNKMYEYLAVPYPEGYLVADNNYLFNQGDINDIIFRGYTNPERDIFNEALNTLYSKKEVKND